MLFASEAERQAYEAAKVALTRAFGDAVHVFDDVPAFAVTGEQAVVFVRVVSQTSRVVLCLRVYVVTGPRRLQELGEFLLGENARPAPGAFALDKDGDLVLHYCLPDAAATPEMLSATVRALERRASASASELASRFGGQVAVRGVT
ncbi:MAG: hypothetical protein J7M26_04390 [Armatimonadetes bacterium]|nr:hypothetical protein [Armatimonadota bacterium]